jgi:hypothetical protein
MTAAGISAALVFLNAPLLRELALQSDFFWKPPYRSQTAPSLITVAMMELIAVIVCWRWSRMGWRLGKADKRRQ